MFGGKQEAFFRCFFPKVFRYVVSLKTIWDFIKFIMTDLFFTEQKVTKFPVVDKTYFWKIRRTFLRITLREIFSCTLTSTKILNFILACKDVEKHPMFSYQQIITWICKRHQSIVNSIYFSNRNIISVIRVVSMLMKKYVFCLCVCFLFVYLWNLWKSMAHRGVKFT